MAKRLAKYLEQKLSIDLLSKAIVWLIAFFGVGYLYLVNSGQAVELDLLNTVLLSVVLSVGVFLAIALVYLVILFAAKALGYGRGRRQDTFSVVTSGAILILLFLFLIQFVQFVARQ